MDKAVIDTSRSDCERIPFLEVLTSLGRSRLGLDDSTLSAGEVFDLSVRERVEGFLGRDSVAGKEAQPFGTIVEKSKPIRIRRIQFSLILSTLFHELLDKCVSHGIEVMLLKGIALNEYIYGDDTCRSMSDIDFMVLKENVTAVMGFMRETGLQPADSQDFVARASHDHHVVWIKHLPLCYCNLECHWHIVPPHSPFPINERELWEHSESREYNGLPVRVLCPEHFLIHICLHWHYNNYCHNLRDMYDMYALLMHNGELDWDLLVSSARRWNADAITYLALTEMARFFNIGEHQQGRIASLKPRAFLRRSVVLRILKQRVWKPLEKTSITEAGPSERSNDMESIILALCSGNLASLLDWLIPSKEKVYCNSLINSEDVLPKCYIRYYTDLLRRIGSVIQRLVSRRL